VFTTFADIAPPLHERVLTSPVALAVAAVALLAAVVITVVSLRRKRVTRTGPPPGT
jgi:hypothetical protein